MITRMRELPQTLYQAQAVRELDRLAIQEAGLPGSVLMARAGAEVFRVLRWHWPRAGRILLVCGTGNNGGDGFVVARLCREAGLEVVVILLGEAAQILGEARDAYEHLL